MQVEPQTMSKRSYIQNWTGSEEAAAASMGLSPSIDTSYQHANGYAGSAPLIQTSMPNGMSAGAPRSPVASTATNAGPAHNVNSYNGTQAHSGGNSGGGRNSKIQIHNVPVHSNKEEIERLVATFGPLQKLDIVQNATGLVVNVHYENTSAADQAFQHLDNYEFHGSALKVEVPPTQYGRQGNGNKQSRPRYPAANSNRGTGYPLRILVPSDFVGAIIGRKGQTIRNITTQSRARVDVQRRDHTGLLEKVISIFGQPENCTNACKEILKVMQNEAIATNRTDATLKMLADDRFCGRIIGKEGKVIKKIREETDTKITVSKNYSFAYMHSVQEVPALFPDRVIIIKGSIDGMSTAESSVSTKLRECFERELQVPVGPGMNILQGNHGMPPLPMMHNNIYNMRQPYHMDGEHGPAPPPGQGHSNVNMQQNQPHSNFYPGYYPNQVPTSPAAPAALPYSDSCQVYVPNSVVGAIIGSGGSSIKEIIRESSAFVTIEPKKDDDPSPAAERVITVKGSSESQWKACYRLFEKLRSEGFSGNEEVRLKTSIRVSSIAIGRLIGKGGKNVRETQRMTGAMIKLPEDPKSQGEDTVVEIYGCFLSTQNAMNRIRALVSQVSGPNLAPASGSIQQYPQQQQQQQPPQQQQQQQQQLPPQQQHQPQMNGMPMNARSIGKPQRVL